MALSLVQTKAALGVPAHAAARRQRGASLLLRAQAAAAEAPPTAEAGGAASADRNGAPSPDDIVVVGAVRTPSTRARKGGLRDAHTDDLMAVVLRELIRRTGVDPAEVGDICFGSVFPPSSKRANEARIAEFLAGFPHTVPVYTINRQCAAGLQSIANVAAAIRAGYFDIGIAGGVESFTKDPLIWEGTDSPRVSQSQHAQDVMLPLGITAENVAERFGVSREEQDRLAAASHAKAAAAQAEGRFREEIVPVETVQKDPNTGKERRVVVADDDGIRADSTPDKLSGLKPYFKKGGTVTAGNACQNTDCAAAVMLMRRAEAERRSLPVMAALRSFAAVGVEPAVMGIAPSVAVPKALERAGLTKEDIDVFEVNEAFSSQAAYCQRVLGLDKVPEKVNPNGGAIALGHPAGATGTRLTVTLLHELKRRNANGNPARYGVVAMCTGAGMGAAAVFEAGDAGGSGSSSGSQAG